MGKILKNHGQRIAALELSVTSKFFEDKNYNRFLRDHISNVEKKLDLLIKTLGYELKTTPEKKEFVKTTNK
jgi:hypothetical protein